MKLMKFAENFRNIIKDRNLKITVISENTGIPLSTLSEWTAGRDPKLSDSLIKLSQYLQVSLDKLILGEDESENEKPLVEFFFNLKDQNYCLKIYEK